MRRLVLHFGTHKTGSTSIQRTRAKASLGPDWEYHPELFQILSHIDRLHIIIKRF